MTGIDVLRVFLHSHSRQQSLTEYHEAFHRILYADRHTKAIMEYALGRLRGMNSTQHPGDFRFLLRTLAQCMSHS
eukprot:CAMPEP_0185038570 /NCGR_PEP_ID=MMETSP1103-20130426/34370_1 /TAXON_ID=36769 /ORGANISM="Paraphysomonas bandaiensis, Strain Caron Lab Isolate" /LENGTH=74 /DNA_ID=CAMNT_0027577057 /DNA_START=189 /DNA_END=409 /DNA_ORIENTATION=+